MIFRESGIALDEGLLKVTLPSTQEQILLWVQVIFLWLLAEHFMDYILERSFKKVRNKYLVIIFSSLLLFLITFFLPGLNKNQMGWRVLLCMVFTAFSLGLPLLQNFSSRLEQGILSKRVTEIEIITVILFITSTGHIIATGGLQVRLTDSLVNLPISSGQLSYSILVAAAIILLLDSGTRIVRDVLDRTGTVPKKGNDASRAVAAIMFLEDGTTSIVRGNVEIAPKDDGNQQGASVIDTKEFNRGKYIGNLERLLILGVVLVGSYETIGFIIAGKGLIRAKEFEDRDFAEYFLIGTLTSTAIAIVVGFLLKFAATKIL